jgi:hypothetical protein
MHPGFMIPFFFLLFNLWCNATRRIPLKTETGQGTEDSALGRTAVPLRSTTCTLALGKQFPQTRHLLTPTH